MGTVNTYQLAPMKTDQHLTVYHFACFLFCLIWSLRPINNLSVKQ